MNLIIVHKKGSSANNSGNGLLAFAMSAEPIAGVVLDGLSKNLGLDGDTSTVIAAPEGWSVSPGAATPEIISYREKAPISFELRKAGRSSWLVVSNGRFVTQIDRELLHRVLAGIQADVVAVNVEPELLGKREKVRLTVGAKVAGFHRQYCDCAEPAAVPADWPHHIFVKTNVLDRVLTDQKLPYYFYTFLEKCRRAKLTLRTINVGGIALDLETEDGLLSFCQAKLSKIRNSKLEVQNSNMISPDSRLVGRVLLGQNVNIGPKAIVIGPTIIGNKVRIGASAVINSSIIGPGVCVPRNQFVQGHVVKGPQCDWKRLAHRKSNNSKQVCGPKFDLNRQQFINNAFRNWPRFSYTGCFKRIADIIAAVIVLVLFAPVLPIIALVIKLTSHGPVFFKDTRQGLHGKAFSCLKFRTMIVGADRIQDSLRTISRVDGPQFKVPDDPRLSAVGSFLRDTYIDEIPQFFNVLLGQMSVVGPRPSPESENTLCPSWRDARLSVRPGITGLWQVYRTRQPMKDFQEWIYYDIKYVRDPSLKMDLWISWKTAGKMVRNIVSQF
jgi:lipopolysaccharide/colanic/teichoic acid biosynthesis glycosyltransferase